MPTPLVATKLHVPAPRPELIDRATLMERLERGARARLVLVSAPAGFGKSSVLAQWLSVLAGRGHRVAWLALDESDSQPSALWSHLVAAIRTAVPGFAAGPLAVLDAGGPPNEGMLAALINDLAALSGDLHLVLDDYHLIGHPDIHTGIAYLLEHLPAQAQLLITTRADPPLPLARLRARGDLVEIRAADLRFTIEEASRFLTGVMGLDLRIEDIGALETRTEGWIAALQLAALSMQGRDDVAGFIAGFTGNDRYIVDYLVEEVLARQSGETRSFLLRTSILEQLSGPLCDAVTGDSGCRIRLERLDRANLLVVALDDRREWYRYHHLFADVLRARLEEELGDQIPRLHGRASEWYEQRGLHAEAIRHALASGDDERTAELVESALPEVGRARNEMQLRSWVDPLPDEVIRRRPVLSVGLAGCRLASGELAGVEELLDGAERIMEAAPGSAPGDERELRRIPGHIAMYRAALAQARGDVPATIEHAQRTLELAPEDDHVLRAGAVGFLGVVSWAAGDLDAAHRAWTEGLAGLEQVGHVPDALEATLALGDICMAQGRLSDALDAYEHGLALAPQQSRPLVRGTADMLVGMSEVLRERNHLDGARTLLLESQELGEHAGMPQHPYRWRVAMARLWQAEGDSTQALAVLEDAEPFFVKDFFPRVRPFSALRARAWIASGHLREAHDWAHQAGLSPHDELSYLREFEHITLARLLLAVAKADGEATTARAEALELLGRLRENAETGARTPSVIEILILTAIASADGEDRPSALAALEQALTAAEPQGYVRLFLDEGQVITDLFRDTSQSAVTTGAIAGLLAGGTPPPAATPHGLLEPLSGRERDVLRLLASDLSGPDIARHLYVSVNTLRTHTKHIFTKLDVNTRRAAVRRAAELGLL